MNRQPDDICAGPDLRVSHDTAPLRTALAPASVYVCEDTDQADQLMSGSTPGYVYQRTGHPNADVLTTRCRALHQADHAAVTATGMGALSLAILSQLQTGDHVVVSRLLYGKSVYLLKTEAARLGIGCTIVDSQDLTATAAACTPKTRMILVETISNPLLRVANLPAIAEIAERAGALLLVDNTFASPVICQPLQLGGHLCMESLSKIMNGHSDVIMGMLAGNEAVWERVPDALSAWGLGAGPFECYQANRGLATLHLRVARATENAAQVADSLIGQPGVAQVYYPGLDDHPDHQLACQQFKNRFGWMVSFRLEDERAAADAFIRAARQIPFCPSLGEVTTTLSHPESTSHRDMPAEDLALLGISGGTIRLSVGCESFECIREALQAGLSAIK